MKHTWTKEEYKYFTKPVPKAERNGDWVGWVLIGAISLTGIGVMIWMII